MRVMKYVVTASLVGTFAIFYQNCAPSMGVKPGVNFGSNTTTSGQKVLFADVRDQIFSGKCGTCHADFLNYNTFMAHGYVSARLPTSSSLYNSVVGGSMPKGAARLATNEINLIQQWINDGALETSTVLVGPMPTPTPTPPLISLSPTYASLRANVFVPYCISCHNSALASGGYNMSTYQGVITGRVFAGNPDASMLYTLTNGMTGPPAIAYTMPKNAPKLSVENLNAIKAWINAGAPNN